MTHPSFRLSRLALVLTAIVLVSGAAPCVASDRPSVEPAAVSTHVPLVHLTAVQSSCAQAFPAIPGQQRCYSMGFYDVDIWAFRDRTGLSVGALQATPGIGGQGTPLAATTRQGGIPAPEWSALTAALAGANVGSNPGRCNPLPPLIGVPPDFPRPVLHARIAWFGKDFRTHVIELGTDFDALCPVELRDLYAALGSVGSAIGTP